MADGDERRGELRRDERDPKSEREPQDKRRDRRRDDVSPCRPEVERHAAYRRPSNRRAEICSETRPTRNTITANMISSTDELVMWRCVKIVHTA